MLLYFTRQPRDFLYVLIRPDKLSDSIAPQDVQKTPGFQH